MNENFTIEVGTTLPTEVTCFAEKLQPYTCNLLATDSDLIVRKYSLDGVVVSWSISKLIKSRGRLYLYDKIKADGKNFYKYFLMFFFVSSP